MKSEGGTFAMARRTKQQSIKVKLEAVRRIPSIKLGTSKYPGRRKGRKDVEAGIGLGHSSGVGG